MSSYLLLGVCAVEIEKSAGKNLVAQVDERHRVVFAAEFKIDETHQKSRASSISPTSRATWLNSMVHALLLSGLVSFTAPPVAAPPALTQSPLAQVRLPGLPTRARYLARMRVWLAPAEFPEPEQE